jgi:hypothetical protein
LALQRGFQRLLLLFSDAELFLNIGAEQDSRATAHLHSTALAKALASTALTAAGSGVLRESEGRSQR